MSVVVFKAGVLAADSRAYGGRGHPTPGEKQKVHRLPDTSRIGVVSSVLGMPERFVAWLAAGADPKEWGEGTPDLRAIVIQPDGRALLYEDALHPSGPIICDAYAIGSGADYALGAMAMGADAVRAVEVACQFDPNSGLPVKTLEA